MNRYVKIEKKEKDTVDPSSEEKATKEDEKRKFDEPKIYEVPADDLDWLKQLIQFKVVLFFFFKPTKDGIEGSIEGDESDTLKSSPESLSSEISSLRTSLKASTCWKKLYVSPAIAISNSSSIMFSSLWVKLKRN